jgi:hypothetical protein
MMLPTLQRCGEKACFESPCYISVPTTIEPVSEVDEKNIFEMLAQSLNANFMTDLALELSTTRFNSGTDDMCTDSALAGKRFVIVGASHGMRLASALEDMGASIVDISVPGWRVSADGVEALKMELSTILSEEFSGETYIIYQLFDNSMYWQCDAEGNRSLPVKGPDNQYHIHGRLVYIERANFKELFMLVLPLLRAGLNHNKVLLSPLMRYVTSSCCNNVGHMVNRREKTFAAAMGLALGEVKEWLQDFTFTRRIRNFTVLCSNNLLQGDGNLEDNAANIKRYWSGPVHLNSEGYGQLAEHLLGSVLEAKLLRPTSEVKKPAAPVHDRAKLRKSWVNQNDSAVHRKYEEDDLHSIRGGRGHGGRGGLRRYCGRGRGGQRGGYKSHYKPRNHPY